MSSNCARKQWPGCKKKDTRDTTRAPASKPKLCTAPGASRARRMPNPHHSPDGRTSERSGHTGEWKPRRRWAFAQAANTPEHEGSAPDSPRRDPLHQLLAGALEGEIPDRLLYFAKAGKAA